MTNMSPPTPTFAQDHTVALFLKLQKHWQYAVAMVQSFRVLVLGFQGFGFTVLGFWFQGFKVLGFKVQGLIPQKLKNNGPAQEFEPWEMMMMMMMMMNSELRRNIGVAAKMSNCQMDGRFINIYYFISRRNMHLHPFTN